jgi:Zinc-binding domain
MSGNSWANMGQDCIKCHINVFPQKQVSIPLRLMFCMFCIGYMLQRRTLLRQVSSQLPRREGFSQFIGIRTCGCGAMSSISVRCIILRDISESTCNPRPLSHANSRCQVSSKTRWGEGRVWNIPSSEQLDRVAEQKNWRVITAESIYLMQVLLPRVVQKPVCSFFGGCNL